MKSIREVVALARSEGAEWDYDQGYDGKTLSEVSVAGHIIEYMLNTINDKKDAHKAIGIFVSNVARRSLPCWFLYCNDTRPLHFANRLIEVWAGDAESGFVELEWCEPIVPMENGKPIGDCREEDTSAAAEAVAQAARFTRSLDYDSAVLAVTCACNAFCVSPLPSLQYEERDAELEILTWMMDILIPKAMLGEDLTNEERDALALYEIPAVMRQNTPFKR